MQLCWWVVRVLFKSVTKKDCHYLCTQIAMPFHTFNWESFDHGTSRQMDSNWTAIWPMCSLTVLIWKDLYNDIVVQVHAFCGVLFCSNLRRVLWYLISYQMWLLNVFIITCFGSGVTNGSYRVFAFVTKYHKVATVYSFILSWKSPGYKFQLNTQLIYKLPCKNTKRKTFK